jgi:hypothetical protein
MNTSLLIEKDGTIKITSIKNPEKLYSICNYRNDTNFEVLYTWKNAMVNYELYGKKKMKGSVKNNYQMPYPIDKELYYGGLCVIKKINQGIVNMTMEDWVLIMNRFKNKDEDNDKDEKDVNERNYESVENDETLTTNMNGTNGKEKEEISSLEELLRNREKELTHEEYEEE